MKKQPPVRFAWLNIGSQGRKEQLLLTDQDNALVFEDVAAERYVEVKKYFIRLAENVIHILRIDLIPGTLKIQTKFSFLENVEKMVIMLLEYTIA
jgi:hypothetical protein